MLVGFGGNKQSHRSKRLDNPLHQRFSIDPVKKAHQLMDAHGQEQAYKIADTQVAAMKKTIEEGAPLEFVFTGKDIRCNLGFWLSVRGYLNRKAKDMRKVA